MHLSHRIATLCPSDVPSLYARSSLRHSGAEGLPAVLLLALTSAAAAAAVDSSAASGTPAAGGSGDSGDAAADTARAAADALCALAAVLPVAQRRQLWPLFTSGDRDPVAMMNSKL